MGCLHVCYSALSLVPFFTKFRSSYPCDPNQCHFRLFLVVLQWLSRLLVFWVLFCYILLLITVLYWLHTVACVVTFNGVCFQVVMVHTCLLHVEFFISLITSLFVICISISFLLTSMMVVPDANFLQGGKACYIRHPRFSWDMDQGFWLHTGE